MSDSLFLDPFSVPARDGGTASQNSVGDDSRDGTGEVVPGTVVESEPIVATATHRVTATIPLNLEQAVGAVLDDIHLWWPADRRATGTEGHVCFEGGKLLEEEADDRYHVWAEVTTASEAAFEFEWFGGRIAPWSSPTDSSANGQSGTLSGNPLSASPGDGVSRTVPGSTVAPGTGVHLSLGFSATTSGTDVSVRGLGPASWVAEWTDLLGALARFTGGALTVQGPDDGEGA